LNDVFGVEIRNSLLPPRDLEGVTVSSSMKPFDKTYTLPAVKVHPDVQVTNAEAMDEADNIPLVSVNRSGKGRAVYLNFSFTEYFRERHYVDWSGFRELMRDVLKSHEIEAPVKITVNGQPHRCVEVVRFQDAGIQYVTLLSDEQPVPEKVPESVVRFPREAYIYDVRKGEFLGFGQEIRTHIKSARAQVYALSPYKIQELAVETESHYRQGDVVKYDVVVISGTLTPRRHCVRIDVFDPQGKVCPWYGKNLFAGYAGIGSGEISLAENDMTGRWTITAKDITSGMQQSASFVVQPKSE
jgi:hypothetical protein